MNKREETDMDMENDKNVDKKLDKNVQSIYG